jgi:hypothetical protein
MGSWNGSRLAPTSGERAQRGGQLAISVESENLPYAHPRQSRIARPMIQSLSASERKSTSSVKMRHALTVGGLGE